ncbi:MAG: TIGR04282 family arsenosugar biosynthesis glycosyltransferase [Myxococcales bacterium]|nr:TIGR04282 family arsenosugar biosynthesis glycosyltransferase [Myxococcales bacterium]
MPLSATVAIMARAPRPGSCKTRLAARIGDERAAELYRAMLLDTLDAYAALPFQRRVVLAAPEHDGVAAVRALVPAEWTVESQVGADLGSRLAHGRTALGTGRVVLASSDSPTAPLVGLARALAEWSDPRRVLLGPCEDGGYYLIGLAEDVPRVFEGVPWSTADVCATTQRRCAELGLEVLELERTFDVDEPADLDRLRLELEAHPERAPRTAALVGGA